MAVQIPPWEGAILGRGTHCIVSAVSCAKTAEPMNRSICRLRCGLGGPKEAQVQSYIRQVAPMCTVSIVLAMWRQCAHNGRHIGATWRIRLGNAVFGQITLTTCYYYYSALACLKYCILFVLHDGNILLLIILLMLILFFSVIIFSVW